jgi:hypothetical protein
MRAWDEEAAEAQEWAEAAAEAAEAVEEDVEADKVVEEVSIDESLHPLNGRRGTE